MISQYIKVMILVCISLLISPNAPILDVNAPPSLADSLHLSRSKDPVDGGWLPNLTGLPTPDQILLAPPVIDVLMAAEKSNCGSINSNLRKLIFQHFYIYQKMLNAQGVYLDDNAAQQWAHVLGMILKESSGDSTSITDFLGHSISTFGAKTSLNQWNKISSLTPTGQVQFNIQTNFGLTQMSDDRLLVAFHLAKDQQYNTGYLEGLEGAETPRKISLNTAIAIRRLIWFYQDFAQGRLVESDARIHQDDINKPEFSARYQEGIERALLYCGTRLMFTEGQSNNDDDRLKLQEAMASIAYCKLGNAQSGYGKNEIDEKCFARWVTLCPALNIDLATLTPLSYFATRAQRPVCEGTFKMLLHNNTWEDMKHDVKNAM